MELKRILARDGRSATEQAIALYGRDVLMIANNQVDGQTELIVAIDLHIAAPVVAPVTLHPAPQGGAFADTFERVSLGLEETETDASPGATSTAAIGLLDLASSPSKQLAWAAPAPASALLVASTARLAAAAVLPTAAEPTVDAQSEQQERLRSREIVNLVRQELAVLREELQTARQLGAWQSTLEVKPALRPLVDALQGLGVPAGLRALLTEGIRHASSPSTALAALRSTLLSNIGQRPFARPSQGLHALLGPSGVGKTQMAVRLAQQAAKEIGHDAVALISLADQRPGAWSQIMTLGASMGVDCFKARDMAALAALLVELQDRQLVLIDTAGTEHEALALALKTALPKLQMHAVLPADASLGNVRRILQNGGQAWDSLLLSKLDEAEHPWPLIQGLCDRPLPFGSAGWTHPGAVLDSGLGEHLIDLALKALQPAAQTAATHIAQAGQPTAHASRKPRTRNARAVPPAKAKATSAAAPASPAANAPASAQRPVRSRKISPAIQAAPSVPTAVATPVRRSRTTKVAAHG